MNIISYIIIFLVVIYALIAAYLYFYQRNIMYLPSGILISPKYYDMVNTKEITLTTPDKLQITAWYTSPTSRKQTVVYFHGNAGNLGDRVYKMKPFIHKGFGLMAISYRGYGNSQGKPSEQGLYIDARESIKYLQDLGHSLDDIVFYGESLGTGVAVQMATEYKVRALVLEAPYTAISDVAQERYPIIPVKHLLKDHYDSKSKIQNVTTPILILHGYLDEIIPINHGRRLLQLANAPKRGLFYEQIGHTNFDPKVMVAAIKEFLADYPIPK